jgi:hypothetical protein
MLLFSADKETTNECEIKTENDMVMGKCLLSFPLPGISVRITNFYSSRN